MKHSAPVRGSMKLLASEEIADSIGYCAGSTTCHRHPALMPGWDKGNARANGYRRAKGLHLYESDLHHLTSAAVVKAIEGGDRLKCSIPTTPIAPAYIAARLYWMPPLKPKCAHHRLVYDFSSLPNRTIAGTRLPDPETLLRCERRTAAGLPGHRLRRERKKFG